MKIVSKLPPKSELSRMGISLYDNKGRPKTVQELLKELSKNNLKN